jgi:hypothetical protein
MGGREDLLSSVSEEQLMASREARQNATNDEHRLSTRVSERERERDVGPCAKL